MKVGFSTKVLLTAFLPVVLLLAGTFIALRIFVDTSVRNDVQASSRLALNVAAASRAARDASDQQWLRELARNPQLQAAIDDATEYAGRNPGRSNAALASLLEQHLDDSGQSVLLVLDAQGQLIAGVSSRGQGEPVSIRPGEAWKAGSAVDPQRRLLFLDGAYYLLTAVKTGGRLGDTLLAKGTKIDFTQFGAAAVLLRSGKVLVSGLSPETQPKLEAALASCPNPICDVEVDGHSYLSLAVADLNLGSGYLLRTLQPAGLAGGALRETIERVFTVAALAAFVVIFVVSILSARSIGRPLTAFAGSLRESESRGTLLPIEISSRVVEVDQLVFAFNQASRAIQENKDKLTRAHVHFIEAMASALDARDVYTAGHSRRVADYACATAHQMGLSEEEIEVIRVGSLLHDVGKIGVPDAILLKPEELTPEEIRVVQLHPTIGRQIVERIEGFEPYLPIIELHHENHDGSGYPRGLKGDETPLATRIVHAVDAYDAMTSDRPYRRGMSQPEALRRMMAASGTQFDPNVLVAFHRTRTSAPGMESSEPSLRDYVQLARGLATSEAPITEQRS